MKGVKQFRFIQEDAARYTLWLNGDRDEMDVDDIVGRIRPYLGERAQLTVEYVDEIPVLASGNENTLKTDGKQERNGEKSPGETDFGNTAYTMGGMLLMNGVLQLAVYPLLNARMGQEELGSVLYIMGLVSILCPSVGQALNTSRLVVRRTCSVTNGDYDRLLLLFAGVGGVAAILGSGSSVRGGLTMALTLLLVLMTAFRYYGDVEYRLNLDYRKYFIYYALISIGYLAGYGLFRLTGNWFLIFLLGEGAALIYVGITGSVFRRFWKKSAYFGTAAVRGFFLTLSYLITNTTLNMDRLALKHMVGNEAVTWYYVVSLIGKTMVLLVAPINTIVISYLTRRERNTE